MVSNRRSVIVVTVELRVLVVSCSTSGRKGSNVSSFAQQAPTLIGYSPWTVVVVVVVVVLVVGVVVLIEAVVVVLAVVSSELITLCSTDCAYYYHHISYNQLLFYNDYD